LIEKLRPRGIQAGNVNFTSGAANVGQQRNIQRRVNALRILPRDDQKPSIMRLPRCLDLARVLLVVAFQTIPNLSPATLIAPFSYQVALDIIELQSGERRWRAVL
jgi:hypothetical protein